MHLMVRHEAPRWPNPKLTNKTSIGSRDAPRRVSYSKRLRLMKATHTLQEL